MEDLLLRGQAGAVAELAPLISAHDAVRFVESLRTFKVDEVGSERWMEQHDFIEKLNLQAHQNAQSHSDEFVKEALVTLDKVSLLVHELLVSEVWKQNVLPLLRDHLCKHLDSMSYYLLLYHETAIANLLEITLYHQDALEAVDEDCLLELCDWCYRKLVYLNADAHKFTELKPRTAKEMMQVSPEQEFEEKLMEVEFGTALCALTIVRYLADSVESLPLSVMTRLVSANDTPMALLPLLERPPWLRRRGKAGERYEGNAWRPVPPADRMRLGQQEAQVWLSLTALVVEPKCRAKYEWGSYRIAALQGLKRHMNDVLFDQLPPLRLLQRAVDEVALGVGPNAADAKTSFFIMEQVPGIREQLLKRGDWAEIAERQRRQVFRPGGRSLLSEARMQSMLQAFEFMCDMQPGEAAAQAGAAAAQQAAAEDNSRLVRVNAWRSVREGVYEKWAEFQFPLDSARPAEPIQLTDGDGNVVRGLRHRLQAVDGGEEASRALPSAGKVVVLHGGRKAEALLELPAPCTRDGAADLAPGLWLTAGLLALDGFALQLKLKRFARPRERDRNAGIWYAYYPVGGAITTLVSDEDVL